MPNSTVPASRGFVGKFLGEIEGGGGGISGLEFRAYSLNTVVGYAPTGAWT